MTANLLGAESSPYLLQHKDNPVHWHPWSADALERAKTEDKPILLSVGYAACHWCHVMAHECFEDPQIAAQMNELFVNIKVDREERPDLDAIYQHALALMGEHGGWPLTMFLTPEGEPFWGGTYFPPEPKWGRPGFPQVLTALADVYRNDTEKVTKNVAAIGEALENLSAPPQAAWAGIQSVEQIDAVAEAALGLVDFTAGGTRGAPKFPQPSLFAMMWRAYKRTRSDDFKRAVTITLDNLCQGGIYDHLGGGFARYATDEKWLVPHFEKMLYDNAQLLELLALAWADTGDELYRIRAAETVDWLVREMRLEDGAFAGTLDADSEGGEGAFYVWQADEIDTLLGADAEAFKQAYDVTPAGNWEDSNILNRLHELRLKSDAEEAQLAANRAVLFEAREKRPRPALDDKILADWNGMMIAALANAGAIFGRDDWIVHARAAFDFVRTQMNVDGRLRHAWRHGQSKPGDMLDDYAQMARAALALAAVIGEDAYLDAAKQWVATADRHFWDSAGAGYFFSPDDAGDLIVRTRTAFDNATPAGNSTMIEVLARLHHLTGETGYGERADATAKTFSSAAGQQLVNMPSLLNGIELTANAVQVAIIGEPDHPATGEMRAAALAAAHPNLVVTGVKPDAALPETHPAAGKEMVGGNPTAYVCVGPVCGLPETDSTGLKAALARL